LWSGGIAALAGDFESLFVRERHTAELAHLLGVTNPHLVWSYPPTAFLPMLPFAMLPYAAAVAAWTLVGIVAYLAAGGLLKPRLVNIAVIAGVALAPGVFLAASYGQTALITSALIAVAITQATARPLLAGGLAALLVAKPHLAIVVPVAFIALQAWRALAAMAAAGLVLMAVTLLAFGLEPWRLFIDITLPQQLGYLNAPRFDYVMLIAPFFIGRSLGLDPSSAYLAQSALSVAVLAVLWFAVSREADRNVHLLMAASAALIASPYLQVYELPILVLAVARIVASDASAERLGRPLLFGLMAAVTVLPFVTLAILTKSGINFTALIPLALLIALAVRAAYLSGSRRYARGRSGSRYLS
jgi:Glycosyltransferase family 87